MAVTCTFLKLRRSDHLLHSRAILKKECATGPTKRQIEEVSTDMFRRRLRGPCVK